MGVDCATASPSADQMSDRSDEISLKKCRGAPLNRRVATKRIGRKSQQDAADFRAPRPEPRPAPLAAACCTGADRPVSFDESIELSTLVTETFSREGSYCRSPALQVFRAIGTAFANPGSPPVVSTDDPPNRSARRILGGACHYFCRFSFACLVRDRQASSAPARRNVCR